MQHAASRRRRHHPVALTSYHHLLTAISHHDHLHNKPNCRKRKREEQDQDDGTQNFPEKTYENDEGFVREEHQLSKRNLLSDDSGIIMFD